ncbi:MAG: hypothetical protein IJJ99_06415 [Oscillospiraceae bacterium]|nr:hypothetical protein [Oscillospiraceae bacterium]
MRNIQIIVIALFLVISVAFSAFFFYDRTMVDREAPVIVCDGVPVRVSVRASEAELCRGLTATDNVDGDLTDHIIVRRVSQLYGSNSALIYYAVFDSSSNYCTYSRSITYTDYRKPRFALSQPLSFNVSNKVTLEGRLSASDMIDGDITPRIRLSSTSVSTMDQGIYPITVQVTNSSGDTAVVTIPVIIQSSTSRHPVIRLSDYLIYADKGEVLTEETLRGYIVSARESSSGALLSPEDIDIDMSQLDTSKHGCTNVLFSYTNSRDLTYTVLLTVVVE